MSRHRWIAEKPVAHRGLHDAAAGIIENTASAFVAAIDGGYAMECDVHLSRDGAAMVFHDDTLDRLMERPGRLADLTEAELKAIPMKAGSDRMISLADLLDLVGGRQPLVIELKASWSDDRRLERRVAKLIEGYRGRVAVMSFDPRSTAAMRHLSPETCRGVVQESVYDHPEWDILSAVRKRALARLKHLPWTRPHFLAWYVRDLDRRGPRLARDFLGLPLLTWTVRTESDRARAGRYADQIIFEGFRP